MLGTILIIDAVSTNRIMLKVQLSAAWYHVVQADRLQGLLPLVRRTRPDLVVTAMALPDGSATTLHAALQGDPATAAIPVIAISAQNDRSARLAALAAGIDDVLGHPVDDTLLQARIRSLLRSRSSAEDLGQDDDTHDTFHLAEAARGFEPPLAAARVALVSADAATATLWRARLTPHVPHHLAPHRLGGVRSLLAEPVPDAIVVELSGAPGTPPGLRLLADLRARNGSRQAAVIAVADPANRRLAAEALDRGAHDVMPGGFCAQELALRLDTQLRRKARADGLRLSVRNGLRAAVRDPLTGLYNRRHALPHLARVAREAAATGSGFAVMLADLDHFKGINDRFGHPAGDAVLAETARRLQGALRPDDMIARIGGEEFMIVMPATGPKAAARTAERLRACIEDNAFPVPGIAEPVTVTISIGVVAGPPAGRASDTCDAFANGLIRQADRALYQAKGAGRNQISLTRPAA
ncbi:MAG: diguanylate cyclase [Jhaorihella sp.]